VIEGFEPCVGSGRFPIKRIAGEEVHVRADIFAEGHDELSAVVRHRPVGSAAWEEVRLEPVGNDRWEGRFLVTEIGWHEYQVEGWVDHFGSWVKALAKKSEAGQDVQSDLLEGARMIAETAGRAIARDAAEAAWLRDRAALIESPQGIGGRVASALDPELRLCMSRHADRSLSCQSQPISRLQVERERARFGAWYELFPRSTAAEPGRHGTFRDVELRLPYVAAMGFDVLYLPPIHPVGQAFRKGPNNSLASGPTDPGSPWAIGSAEGGHTAIHKELGTFDDFEHLVAAARALGLEVALDIAFQCSPEHPWVTEHPAWFRHRPDGTIKYAENPPKKYQDIYPLNFETSDWKGLWEALRDVFVFWLERGVSIFRVDNPHTKPFSFWEWCLRDVWSRYPSAIFLAEAFTRPKVMKYLAKCGFNQSYTYFTWRNDKQGLTDYFTELCQTDVAEYMRPNLFANTPDILHEYLQTGGRPAFLIRLVLAATLGASYGIYGPPFELCVGMPIRHGSEEYLDSEKYQVRHWDLDASWSLRDAITRINTIRRENPALHDTRNLRFYPVENPQLLCYAKATPDLQNLIVTVVNLDPFHTQVGWVTLPVDELKLNTSNDGTYQVHDLLHDERYIWRGERNFVILDPHTKPAHIFRVRRKVRSETDYDPYE
jgi:starch synthase (maltosyl-transferring)